MSDAFRFSGHSWNCKLSLELIWFEFCSINSHSRNRNLLSDSSHAPNQLHLMAPIQSYNHIHNSIGRTQTWFRDYWKFSKFWKIFWSFCWASKMTPTDEFWVRRRILEPRYRNFEIWNFRAGQLPLKMTFSQKFCFHAKEH